MILTVALLSLCASGTTSAFKFHLPIPIIRPLENVHNDCANDVATFCGDNTQSTKEIYSFETLAETNSDFLNDDKYLRLATTRVISPENSVVILNDLVPDDIQLQTTMDEMMASAYRFSDGMIDQADVEAEEAKEQVALETFDYMINALLDHSSSASASEDSENEVALDYDPIDVSNKMVEYGQDILDSSDEPEDTEDGKIRRRLARRLSEVETKKVIRTYSLSIGVRFGDPKNMKSTRQRNHLLNYGPTTDTCLWKAFDDKKVSSQCVTALEQVNEALQFSNIEGYDDKKKLRMSLSVSFSGATLFTLILCCVLIRELLSDEDEEEEEEGDESYEAKAAYVAMPVQVV